MGPACWNLLGADVVLADGAQTHAGAGSHPELFWALQGAMPPFPES
jgi:hypothetical protein